MRHNSVHRAASGRMEVKMTPMIDVIFLLLVFFVCTASFQAVEEVLPTHLLLSGASNAEAPVDPRLIDLDEIVVAIGWTDGRARWRINDKDYERFDEVGAVLAAVARLKNELPVILDADDNVPLENVIDAYDLCRRLGLVKIQFAASEGV